MARIKTGVNGPEKGPCLPDGFPPLPGSAGHKLGRGGVHGRPPVHLGHFFHHSPGFFKFFEQSGNLGHGGAGAPGYPGPPGRSDDEMVGPFFPGHGGEEEKMEVKEEEGRNCVTWDNIIA